MRLRCRIGWCCLLAGSMVAGNLMAQARGGARGGGVRGGFGVGGFNGGYRGFGGSTNRFNTGYYRPFLNTGAFGSYGFGASYWPPVYSYWGTTGPNYAAPVYEYSPSPNVTIIYPGQQSQASRNEQVQPVVVNYDRAGQEMTAASEPASSPIYLIATKDQVIRAASSYRVDGNVLRFVTPQREEKQVPLDSVDRAFSEQLNRERRVAFRLPQ